MRGEEMRFIRAAALLIGVTFAAAVARGENGGGGGGGRGGHFSPPGETFTDQTRLTELTTTLDQKQYPAAAVLADALLAEDAENLMSARDRGAVISVSAWLDALPSNRRAALSAAYRDKFEATVATQLDALRHQAHATPEAFYTLARRRRFCPSGAAAYADGADRALDGGDLPTAAAMYDLAKAAGWVADEAQAARIELLHKIVNGALIPLPAESSSAAKPRKPFAGPIPFDAGWFDPKGAGAPRLFPAAADDGIFLAGPTGPVCLREGGQVVWSNALPGHRSAATTRPDRPVVAWQPAVLHDVYGRGQVVVARRLARNATDADDNYALAACRADDGKPLWSTEAQPLMKDLSFAGTPAVAGRYTYALAVGGAQPGGERATLTLVALDTLDGELRWQTTLGTFDYPREQQKPGEPKPWDAVWSTSEPLVVGDAIYLTPGCRLVACVGRFDGRIRWLRSYPPSATPPLRWRGTPALCGEVLVTAPADAAEVIGFDAATGKALWAAKSVAPTLVGGTAMVAILAGPEGVNALNARDGKPAWHYAVPGNAKLTGPAVVTGDLVLIPTAAPMVSLRAGDGSVAQRDVTGVPFLRRALNADPIKRVLEEMGASKSFVAP
jgi:outer membrane protein assembly factor BamB